MGFSIKRTFVFHSISKLSKTAVFAASIGLAGTAIAGQINIPQEEPGHLSTLQVKTAVKKIHKGRIIYSKRSKKPGYPNCHIIKMITTTGEFKYIRYACPTE